MEQQCESTLRNDRGAMNAVTVDQLKDFVEAWEQAEGQVVQYWSRWEGEAARFFGVTLDAGNSKSEAMHGVMLIVIGVVRGTISDVKAALRRATPSALEHARVLLSHLPQFAAVLNAEVLYRQRKLVSDWKMQAQAPGRVIVRTELKALSPETEH